MRTWNGRIGIATGLALALTPALLGACGTAGDGETDPVLRGRAVYERAVGGLACADCHGDRAEPLEHPDWRPTGHALAGVGRRESLWGGRFEGAGRLTKAALLCAARYQYRIAERLGKPGREDFKLVPMAPGDRTALEAYLGTFAGDEGPRKITRDADVDPVFELTGDPDRGERVWNAACATCHGDAAEGGLGPPLSGDSAVDAFTFAEYVRSGSLEDADGWMPWFRKDRLSDQELADLCSRWAE